MEHKTPTVEQKILMYSQVLKLVASGDAMGICQGLLSAQRMMKLSTFGVLGNKVRFSVDSPVENPENNMETNFPEITKHKPDYKNYNDFWWTVFCDDGIGVRVEILKAEIELLKEKQNG